MKRQHDFDCTIYAVLLNNRPEVGICTCGYGWSLVRKGDWSEMYSQEMQEKLELESSMTEKQTLEYIAKILTEKGRRVRK